MTAARGSAVAALFLYLMQFLSIFTGSDLVVFIASYSRTQAFGGVPVKFGTFLGAPAIAVESSDGQITLV